MTDYFNIIEFLTSLLEANPNVAEADDIGDGEVAVEMKNGTQFFIIVEPS